MTILKAYTYLLAAGMLMQGGQDKSKWDCQGPCHGTTGTAVTLPMHDYVIALDPPVKSRLNPAKGEELRIPTVTEALKVSVKDEPNGPMCMMYPGCGEFTKWCKKTGENMETCSDKPTYHVEYQCKDGDSVLFESVNGNKHICVRF